MTGREHEIRALRTELEELGTKTADLERRLSRLECEAAQPTPPTLRRTETPKTDTGGTQNSERSKPPSRAARRRPKPARAA